MRRIRSGLMRTPFEVYSRVTALDEFGQNLPSFVDSSTKVFGYIKGLTAQETLEREGMVHARTYEIMVRSKEKNLFASTARLVSLADGRTFEIEGIQEYDDRQQTLTVRVREIS